MGRSTSSEGNMMNRSKTEAIMFDFGESYRARHELQIIEVKVYEMIGLNIKDL